MERACRSDLGTSPSKRLTWPVRACLYVSLSRGKERDHEATSGNRNPATRKVLGKGLVKRLRTVLSQCRGRGFESLHLHQRPRSEAQSGIPKITSFVDVTLRVFIDHSESCALVGSDVCPGGRMQRASRSPRRGAFRRLVMTWCLRHVHAPKPRAQVLPGTWLNLERRLCGRVKAKRSRSSVR